MVTEGIEPSTVALLAQRSNQLSYATSLVIYKINSTKNLLIYIFQFYLYFCVNKISFFF